MSLSGWSESDSSSQNRLICYHSCSTGNHISPSCWYDWLSTELKYVMYLSQSEENIREKRVYLVSGNANKTQEIIAKHHSLTAIMIASQPSHEYLYMLK